MSLDLSPYAARRAKLAASMPSGAIAIIPTAPEVTRNRDNTYTYRFDSYFYYLTGFIEPNAVLVLDSNGRSTLFCQPKDLQREIWDGYRLGPDAAPATLGVDAALSIDAIDSELPRLLENHRALWWPFATHEGLNARIEGWLASVRRRVRLGATCPGEQHDVCALLDDMRLVKDTTEIDLMRTAGSISADGHLRAMRRSAQLFAHKKPAFEYQLEAEIVYAFRDAGAEYTSYDSIVASGANACVLHYGSNNAAIKDGDLVMIDAGCEYHGYAGDISRTFPANGRFTAAQRDLYEVVLASQKAAIAATRPGARFNDPHIAAVKILAQGMLDFGLLDSSKVGSLDDVLESRAYQRFYMHRTSHWLGLDVHDCGSYVEPSEIDQVTERQDPVTGAIVRERPSRILHPGMVITIEPGIYVRAADDIPSAFRDIGIRIEDDALLTASGCELLTRKVPVEADAIEALMRDAA